MIDTDLIETLRAQAVDTNERYAWLKSLMFTNAYNLSEGGRGLIAEAKRRNLKQSDIADLLGISPSAVNKHWQEIEPATRRGARHQTPQAEHPSP